MLHANLLHKVFLLPMAFFDTNPSGRIINRCGKDINVIDESLPSNLGILLTTMCRVLGTVFIISMTTPVILAAFVPLGVIYLLIQVQSYFPLLSGGLRGLSFAKYTLHRLSAHYQNVSTQINEVLNKVTITDRWTSLNKLGYELMIWGSFNIEIMTNVACDSAIV